jgi:hypothetical protein
VNVRSHTKASVVNKVSRSNRSTAFDEQTVRSSSHAGTENGTKDASVSGLSNSSSNLLNGHSISHPTSARTKRANSECIFSTAVTLIRQPTENFVSGLSVPFNMDSMCLAAVFGTSRGFINPEEMMNQQEQSARACSSLFIISWHGRLIEYVLEPVPGKRSLLSRSDSPINRVLDTSKHGVRVTSETPLALKASPKAQWLLQRYGHAIAERSNEPSFSRGLDW